VFTTAERRALDQLSTDGGRLAVVAADQRTKLREARQGAENAEEDSEEYKRYVRNVKRYEAFLEVAGS
jgi:tagatose-1,6-bisphosphate aldolase